MSRKLLSKALVLQCHVVAPFAAMRRIRRPARALNRQAGHLQPPRQSGWSCRFLLGRVAGRPHRESARMHSWLVLSECCRHSLPVLPISRHRRRRTDSHTLCLDLSLLQSGVWRAAGILHRNVHAVIEQSSRRDAIHRFHGPCESITDVFQRVARQNRGRARLSVHVPDGCPVRIDRFAHSSVVEAEEACRPNSGIHHSCHIPGRSGSRVSRRLIPAHGRGRGRRPRARRQEYSRWRPRRPG